ncbi:MAG TPA: SCO family protein [Candidatus Methylacidiphilales bacterium]|nr:SCO family protein [Candidatus Methylacidiphilales bacterium]
MLIPALVAGCRQSSNSAVGSSGGTAGSMAGEVKTFPIKGKIVSVDAANGSILLDAGAVPGFMDAMTMTYKLKQPGIASDLHPGDLITATLLTRKVGDEYQDVVLDQIVVTAQAKPDYKPAVQYHVPTAGDTVPDFKLVNEDGRTIHLGEFKGRALLLTFIYTRCPLPDYCPRMNHNFAEIDKALEADPAMMAKTHLLSISFDPKDDTPAVLKSYGQAYAGVGAKFDHWEFTVPPAKELTAVLEFFDVGVTPGDGGTLTHSLSTVLIGKDGKVAAWYPSNDWSPAEVLAAMKGAATG